MAARGSVDFPGYEASFIRSQEHVERRQFDGLRRPLEGCVAAEFLHFLLRHSRRNQRGPHGSGCDSVDGDTGRGGLECKTPDEPYDARLPVTGERIVVFLQERGQGRVLGAAEVNVRQSAGMVARWSPQK